jgi:hypothetical protein
MQSKEFNVMSVIRSYMNGILIAYRLRTPHDRNVASALVKKLYGQNTSSHGGKYRYRRKGLLDKIPSSRLIRGVIIVRKKDKKEILELLDGFDAEVHVREVMLKSKDLKALDLK